MVFAGFFISSARYVSLTVEEPTPPPDAVFVTGDFDVSGATLLYQDQLLVTPTDIEFKTDGTKLFVSLEGSTSIYEYSLSSPWDLTTISSEATSSLSVSSMTQIQTIDFNRNGIRLYACGSGKVAEFSLSSAYDLSTAGSQSTLDISAYSGQTIYGACFSNSVANNYLHFTSSATGYVNTISTIEIESPLSSSVFLGRSANVVPFISNVVASDLHTTRTLDVSGGGSRFYQIYRNTDFSNVFIVEFKLGTPHDASTLTSATQVEDYYKISEQLNISFDAVDSLKLKPDGSEIFVYGSNSSTNSNVVNTYTLDIPTPVLYISGEKSNTYDILGTSEDVTATGTGDFISVDTISKVGSNCLTFDNSTTSVVVPNFSEVDTLPISVGFWYQKTNYNTEDVLFTTSGFNSSSGTTSGFSIHSQSTTGEFIQVECNSTDHTTSSIQSNNFTWHHLFVTIDSSGSIEIYVNGTRDTSTTASGWDLDSTNFATGQNLILGDDPTAATHFGGYLDDIRVFNVVIPEQIVKKIYLDGVAPVRSQAFHLTFEDTSADIIPAGASLGGTSLATIQSDTVVYQGTYSGDFTGATSCVYIQNWTTAFDGPFTFSMWIYQTSAGSSSFKSFGGLVGYSSTGFRFYTYGNTIYVYVTGTQSVNYTYPQGVQNKWIHVVFTSVTTDTDSFHTLYIDGIKRSTNTTKTLYTVGQDIIIGYVGAWRWDGYIDDYRIYDYAMNPSEVEYLYTTTVSHKNQIFYVSYDQSNVYEYHNGTEDVTATGSGTYIQDPGSKIGSHSGQYPYGTTGTLVPTWTGLTTATELTFSFWIFPKILTNYHVIFNTTGFASGTTGIGFELFKDGSGNLQFMIYTKVSSSFRFRYVSLTNADTYLNKWTHVGCTYTSSSTTSKIFINGVEQTLTASGTWSFSGVPSGDDLRIGNYNGNSQYEFNGSVDDFRVFSRALPGGEIQALYRQYTQSRIYTLDVPTS